MSSPRPNIVLVSIDSLRADHCGFLGDDRGLTPAMDDLAADGVSFENAIATGPQTFSSMPAAFTGEYRHPNSMDVVSADTHWERRMGAIRHHVTRYETLPERLQELGYTTAGFSPNPWTSRASGFERGFDRFEDFSSSNDDGRIDRLARRIFGEDPDRKAFELARNLITGSSFFAQWESFYDDVRETAAELSEPYFLWVFLLDSHFPFMTTRRHREEQTALGMYYGTFRSQQAMRGNSDEMSPRARRLAKRGYRDTVRAVDDFFDRMVDDFADDDPVTVVHSDHGESFGDHGNYGHHHRDVYEENVHVPFFVHGADVSGTVAEPTSLAALPRIVTSVAADGRFDPQAVSADVVFASSEEHENRTARGSRFKYVERSDDAVLYDLDADDAESVDVSQEHPEIRNRLERALDSHDQHVREAQRLDHATHALAGSGHF